MFINSAGSLVIVQSGVDYTPEWISTSPHLHTKTADAGNGPGYKTIPIGALQVLADPGEIVMWTLNGNTKIKGTDLNRLIPIVGGSLDGSKYYYKLSIVENGYKSFPSPVETVTLVPNQKTIRLKWNRVAGADSYVLFRTKIYGSWTEMLPLDSTILTIDDDGTLPWVANTVTDFGVPVTIPAGAFIVGHVYNIWLRKYTGSVDNAFLGYKPPNYPTEF